MVCGHSLCNFVPHKLLKEQVAEYVSCFALAGSPTPSYLLVLVVTVLLAFADRSAVDEHLGGNPPPPHPHHSVINRKRFLWTLSPNRKKKRKKEEKKRAAANASIISVRQKRIVRNFC